MFFTSKINYKTKPVLNSYSSKSKVVKLVKVEPPTVNDSNLVPYLNPIWKSISQIVNFQEQIDLQKSNLITPEYVLKTGVELDTSNVSYNQMNDTNLNVADKINLAKNIKQVADSNFQKQQLKNSQQPKQQPVAKNVESSNDSKIQNLQKQIDDLKKGVNK